MRSATMPGSKASAGGAGPAPCGCFPATCSACCAPRAVWPGSGQRLSDAEERARLQPWFEELRAALENPQVDVMHGLQERLQKAGTDDS